jgi:hypothetical protein
MIAYNQKRRVLRRMERIKELSNTNAWLAAFPIMQEA